MKRSLVKADGAYLRIQPAGRSGDGQQVATLVVADRLNVDTGRCGQLADRHLFHDGLDSVLRYIPRLAAIDPYRNRHVTALDALPLHN